MTTPHLIRQFAGLFGSTNPYAIAPEGALEQADNCVTRAQEVLSSRRGHSAIAIGAQICAIGFMNGITLAMTWDNTATGVTGQLFGVNPVSGLSFQLLMNPGAFPYSSPGGQQAFTRFISANKSLYFQSRYGLTKIESLSSAPGGLVFSAGTRCAIQPPNYSQSQGTNLTVSNGGTVNWLQNGWQVAYRFTICRNGANGELIESQPSERMIAQNTSGADGYVFVQFGDTYMIPTDAFIRFYRSQQVLNASTPSDEMFLVGERFPISTSPNQFGYCRSGTSINFSDFSDDNKGGAPPSPVPLYTNPISGDGIVAANTPAPIALDMAYFKNRLLLLNTTDLQRLTIKVIGTGSGGISDGDTITIANVKLTFRTTPVSSTDVQIYTAGTVPQNLENTARALCFCINRAFDGFFITSTAGIPLQTVVMAQYISVGIGKDFGQVLLQRLVPGADAITVQTSSSNGWDADYTTSTSSSANAQAAGLSWSPVDQPEAVPLENSAIVGDAASAGQRIVALKEAALIFKQSDGLWRWTDDGSGNNAGVAITLADPTVRLLAPETAQAVDNFVLGLCDQGVLLFSEQGQGIDVSYDEIGKELQRLVSSVGIATLAKVAFAVAYQAEHEYILCLPETPNATSCSLQYVFNLQTKTWNRWKLPGVVAGGVDPSSGKLVWAFSSTSTAPAAANSLWVERKAGDSTDYQDPGFTLACPVTTATATMVFVGDFTTGVHAFAAGDIIQQAQTTFFLQQRVVSAVYDSQANQTTVTLDAAPSTAWTNAKVIAILKAIQCSPKFLPWHAGAPLTVKQWGDIFFIFRYLDLDWLTYTWTSEILTTPAATERITSASATATTGTTASGPPIIEDLFGSKPFGSAAFDRQTRDVAIKTTLPQEVGSCALLTLQLNLGNALCRWELCAVDAKIEGATQDVAR